MVSIKISDRLGTPIALSGCCVRGVIIASDQVTDIVTISGNRQLTPAIKPFKRTFPLFAFLGIRIRITVSRTVAQSLVPYKMFREAMTITFGELPTGAGLRYRRPN